MPYIPEAARSMLDSTGATPINAGELNYNLAAQIDRYLGFHKRSYQSLNDVLGVLSALDFEIKRRMLAPYEDRKINSNGDVFSKENVG